MSRPPREDAPGTFHHLSNRGIAKRAIIEDASDARFLISRFAREVRRGRIEVHAFTLLHTHFHALVKSVTGELSTSMQWIQDQHARRFNRRRQRDGHLFRGRFRSRPVDNPWHFEAVVRYIHQNPVEAGLAREPEGYPWSSARHFLADRLPRWLQGSLSRHGSLGKRLLRPLPGRLAELVDRRLKNGQEMGDPFSELRLRGPSAAVSWLRWKEMKADGVVTRHVLVSPQSVEGAIAGVRSLPIAAREMLYAGLLRTACGLSIQEIADRCSISYSAAQKRTRRHLQRMGEDMDYLHRAGDVLSAALEEDFPDTDLPMDVFEATRRLVQGDDGD